MEMADWEMRNCCKMLRPSSINEAGITTNMCHWEKVELLVSSIMVSGEDEIYHSNRLIHSSQHFLTNNLCI